MDADKRREQRRRAARDRVAQRIEEGDEAENLLEELRQRQGDLAPGPVESERSERADRPVPRSRRVSREPGRRRSTTMIGISSRTLEPDELHRFNEERDAQLASSARSKAAIQGLVPFDRELFAARLGPDEAELADHCGFGHCTKLPKWMAPERPDDLEPDVRAYCHEHVAPPV